MATIRYRASIKVLCETCKKQKEIKGFFDFKCQRCKGLSLRYNNVNNIITFVEMIDKNFPDWEMIWIFEYIKGQDSGRLLATYRNWYNVYSTDSKGNKIKTGKNRDMPTRRTI